MYKNLALFNGALIALMIFLNGVLANKLGSYASTLVYHMLGLLLILFVALIKKNRLPRISGMTLVFLIPGILSVLTILFNNITIPKIGVTLAGGIALFGQLTASSIIENFGLFGAPKNKIRKEKIIGFTAIFAGIIVMITL